MRPAHAFFLLLFVAACNEDPKKTAATAPKAPEPIPSDFVVNGFFNSGTEVQVKGDGGSVAIPMEAGAAATAQNAGDPGAADPPAGSGSNVKLLEAGDEPRAARKYDLKAGRAEALSVTLRSTMSQEAPGQPAMSQAQPGMVFSISLTPQAHASGSDTDVKVTFTRAEVLPTPETDPGQAKQLTQAFKVLAGQQASFRLGAHGAISGFALSSEQLARSELASIAQQTLEGLFVVLPDEPIGKGARWEELAVTHQDGVTVTMTSTYTLKDVGADGLSISVATTRKAPKQPISDPRAPKGTSVAVDGTASGLIKVRVDRMPQKGTVESTTAITIGQPAGPGGPTKAVVQKVSMKQTIDNSTP